MVRLILSGLSVFMTVLIVACGGENSPTASPPAARATAADRVTSGPSATIEPERGRPGTEVVVSGRGWDAGAPITIAGAAGGATPQTYATVTAGMDGSFTSRFRLDRSPFGGNLNPGRLNLVAASGSSSVTLSFDVLPPQPGGAGGAGGPGGG